MEVILKLTRRDPSTVARDDEVAARDQLATNLAQINFLQPAGLLRLAKILCDAF